MKLYKSTTGLCLVLIAFGTQTFAQSKEIESRWTKHISLKKYLQPFWKADTIYEEIVQVIKDKGQAEGSLLFDASEIISVKSADLQKTFKKGKDWTYENGKFLLLSKSKIPFLDKDSLLFTKEKPNWSMAGKKNGTFVLFNEGGYFRSVQISVTYIPSKTKNWKGPLPLSADTSLPLTRTKLNSGTPLKVVFYGNSIETGANSSGFQNQPPYMPSWPELIIYNLRQTYGNKIDFSNKSVGGKLAQWGEENVAAAILPEKPDLVVIGFGMNDGTFNIAPEIFRNTIKNIMDGITAKNSNAEFILISPMLANPDATQSRIQSLYKPELEKLVKKGVVLADITSVHQELLKHKSYQDMTGNNVNHPNDYLARWYAQFISGLLQK